MANQNKNSSKNEFSARKKRKRVTILVAMIILLTLLFIIQCELSNLASETLNAREMRTDSLSAARERARQNDSLAKVRDSLARIQDSLAREDSLSQLPPPAPEKPKNDSLQKREKAIRDSLAKIRKAKKDRLEKARKALQDSLAKQDSLRKADSIAYANRDSIPPEASIVPPAGRYYDPIRIKVKCDEIKCKTFYSIGDTLHPQELTAPVEYNKTGEVFYLAEDSAGNRTSWQSVHYDMASDNVCGKNAYPVPVGQKTVCVDAYEYPNQPDAIVKDMVSHEQAVELCKQAGKRLCKFDEWSAACKGKDGFRYAYGKNYKPSKCNTNTKSARRAGRKEQCRSWYGMYDMNGNLWEWTDTPAKEMPNRYLVAGGSWDTQNESKCTDTKYSFYPQNQYNFVGFRCCADATP